MFYNVFRKTGRFLIHTDTLRFRTLYLLTEKFHQLGKKKKKKSYPTIW